MARTYFYKGLSEGKGIITGHCVGSCPREVLEHLSRRNIRLISCKRTLSLPSFLKAKVSTADLQGFFVYMLYTTRAGLPIYQSLKDLPNGDSKSLHDLGSGLISLMERGCGFVDALKQYPSHFPSPLIAILSIAETTGKLEWGFQAAHGYFLRKQALDRKLYSSLLYPLLLGILLMGMLIFFFRELLPQLEVFLSHFSSTPPLSTRALMATLSFFVCYSGLFLQVLLVVLGAALCAWPKSWKIHLHCFVFKLPWIGPLAHLQFLKNFSEFHSILLEAHVDLLKSLTVFRDTQNNVYIKKILDSCIQQVNRGESFNNSLRNCSFFPSFFLSLIETGEKTAALPSCFYLINTYYSQKFDEGVTRITEAIHPLLLLLIGGFFIWIILAVFSPLYDSFSKAPL